MCTVDNDDADACEDDGEVRLCANRFLTGDDRPFVVDEYCCEFGNDDDRDDDELAGYEENDDAEEEEEEGEAIDGDDKNETDNEPAPNEAE